MYIPRVVHSRVYIPRVVYSRVYVLPTHHGTREGIPGYTTLPTMVLGRYTLLYASHTTLGIPQCTYHPLYMLSVVGTGTRRDRDETLGSEGEKPMGERLSGLSSLLRCEREWEPLRRVTPVLPEDS